MMRISSLFVSSLMAALVGLSKASPSAPTKSFIHTVEFGNCVTSAGGTLTDGLVTAGVAINDNSGTTFELEFWIDPAMTKAFSVDVTSTATALGQVELFLGGSDAAYTAGIPANGAVVLTDGAKVLHCVQWGTGATNSGCTAPPIAMALGDVYHIENVDDSKYAGEVIADYQSVMSTMDLAADSTCVMKNAHGLGT
eukprot:Selendium_serpulae@DN4539_c0_g1_i3.p1